MASGKRAKRTERRAQARTAIAAAAAREASAHVLFSDRQRRAVCMLLLSGLGFAAVAAFAPPRGAGYWLAFALVPLLGLALGFALGGPPGRALDTRLMGREEPQARPRPVPPAALPDDLRTAAQAAILPALLNELAQAAERMAAPQRAAALALVAAGARAPEGAARQALARDAARLFAALAEGGTAAVAESELLARSLGPAPPAGGVA